MMYNDVYVMCKNMYIYIYIYIYLLQHVKIINVDTLFEDSDHLRWQQKNPEEAPVAFFNTLTN